MPAFIQDRVIPLVVFPALSATAFQLLFPPVFDAAIDLGANCKPIPNILGIPVLDEKLCPFVTFFTELMHDSVGQAFLTYALGVCLPLVLIPAVEAHRPGQSRALRYPMLWFFVSQVVTIGVTVPLYWLAFVVTGGARKARPVSTALYRQSDVLAIAFGLFIGAIIPSVAMMMMDDFGVTALWQIYPIFIAIAQYLHLQAQPGAQHGSSGYTALQVVYFGALLLSSSVHVSTVWPMITDLEGLSALLVPSIQRLPPTATAAQLYLNFLKWDVVLAYTSAVLASFWSADSARQVVAMVVWYALSIPVLGFGASVMGVALWRNGLL